MAEKPKFVETFVDSEASSDFERDESFLIVSEMAQNKIGQVRKYSQSSSVEPKKILVANRSEIAIRIFRTAHELGLYTVAIYSHEDRFSMHRQKADEAYEVGKKNEFTPVGSYMAMDAIIEIAKEKNAHMIHPGYGFLSESAEFARKVKENGIIFVGPSPDAIESLGDKVKARKIAAKCGVPIVPGTPDPVDSLEEGFDFVREHGFPVILKAAMGGGGRGMRVVRSMEEFEDAFKRAKSESKQAFNDDTIFIERLLEKAKHIEVQLLADNYGNVVHLFERDCSVQRRHQKVVEVAPAKNLKDSLRQKILQDAIKIAKEVNYSCAGTAEFLVDEEKEEYYFIEINPRIQVEHTITEEITGIDIVSAQIQIANGKTLSSLGLSQDQIRNDGFAIQCRVTTEDPENAFAPDFGKIEVYRSSGGPGVRLDGANGYAGAIITPHYDSLLVKVTCWANTYEATVFRLLRTLVEFRIRGVKTNIPFLISLLTNKVFGAGDYWTTFVDDTPELFKLYKSQNRAQKLLLFLAETIVNGSTIPGQKGDIGLKSEIVLPELIDPLTKTLIDVKSGYCQEGWREILISQGPKEFAKRVREYKGCLIMDTTWRDAHQSIMATRLRTIDLLNIAPCTSFALKNAFSLEMWGGATFDVSMRFLHECPWNRLKKLRKLVPNIPFQMLLRGANGLAYSCLPDNAVYFFCVQAKSCGIDIFRVFDALNDTENLALGVDAVKKAGGVCEATICFSGDMLKTGKKYDLDYYLELAEEIVSKMDPDILGIKDMAGCMRPRAATLLISELRKRYPDIPIHVHTHDSAGTGVASMIACAKAGADVVDACSDSMSGTTSQPSIGAIIAGLEDDSDLHEGTGLIPSHVRELDIYWQQIRMLYSCFDADLKGSDPDVYEHEIPGGQLTNLKFQAAELGLALKWKETKKAYEEANRLMGDIVKVTPTSKAVGDLAQFMVANQLDYDAVIAKADDLNFPDSVLDFFQGMMGQPRDGFPEPLRSKILRGHRNPILERPGKSLVPADIKGIAKELAEKYSVASDLDVASYTQFPKIFHEYKEFVEKYGDISVIPTRYVLSKPEAGEEIKILIEQGKLLLIKYMSTSAVNERTGFREVYFEMNGEIRHVSVEDKTAVVKASSRRKADPKEAGDVAIPMTGVIVEVLVKEGDRVRKDQVLAVLSAMKMEMVITAPLPGEIRDIFLSVGDSVEAGDLLATIGK